MRAGRSVISSDGWSRKRVATGSGHAEVLVAGARRANAGALGYPSFAGPPGDGTADTTRRAALSQIATRIPPVEENRAYCRGAFPRRGRRGFISSAASFEVYR